jgi:hypothetical protein
MTHEHISREAARLPSLSSGGGLLHAIALMAEHEVKAVLVRDEGNAVTGVFRLLENGVQFERVGS